MRPLLFSAAFALSALALSPLTAPAQAPEGLPEKAEIQSAIDAIPSLPDLDDAAREKLRATYARALASLDQTAKHEAERAGYERALATAEEEVKKAKAEQAGLAGADKTADARAFAASAPEALDAALASLAAEIDGLKAEKAETDSRRAGLLERPAALTAEMAETAAALRDPEEAATASGPADAAARIARQAARAEARARLKKLEAEQASMDARGRILEARNQLLEARIAAAETRRGAALSARSTKLDQQAEAAGKQALLAREKDDPEAARIAGEIEKLSAELARTAKTRSEVEALLRDTSTARSRMEEGAASIRSQADSADIGGLFAEALLEERVRLPAATRASRSDRGLDTDIADIRLRAFRIAEAKRAIRTADDADTPPGSAYARELEAKRRDLVDRLDQEYAGLTRQFAALGFEEQALLESAETYRLWLDRKLFAVRSLEPIGPSTPAYLREALKKSAAAWQPGLLAKALSEGFSGRPALVTFALLTALASILLRPRMRRVIVESGQHIRRISEDRFTRTLLATALTAARALTLPAALYLLSLAMEQAPEAGRWTSALGVAFARVSRFLSIAFLLIEFAAPKGLGEAHFRWGPESLAKLRRNIRWLYPIQCLCVFAISLTFGLWETDRSFHEVGRFAYMIADTAMAVFIAILFHPPSGIFARTIAAKPDGWLARLAPVWYPALLSLPLAMTTLAGLGYYFAALGLRQRFANSAHFLLFALVGHALIYRWFAIKQRMLSLKQSIEERKEADERAEGSPSPDDFPDIDEPEIDLGRVQKQTAGLLRFLLFAVLATGFWSIWSPLLSSFSGAGPGWEIGGIPLHDIASGILILAVTAVTAKNLPGLLELAILQNLPIRQGTRYAIATLCQYAAIGAGVTAAFHVAGFDPSKLGWIVAALSVGLGFGLQEVVANFVCGLIILFERPVRVGDVVTIGEVSGTVARINIRATTILDWDRKEFIVPNKEFITGRLLNWTLSSSVNRLSVNVGIAYGADPRHAESVILEIARGIPEIMEDPAPFVIFESFGDSSLNLSLKFFLPSTDSRLSVIHRLNGEIHRRFREEGIEIPFPQRDLNIRRDPTENREPRDQTAFGG